MGTIFKIPLIGDAQMNPAEAGLQKPSPYMVNAYTDEAGAIQKRPGLSLVTDLGTGAPVEGLYWWEQKGWLIAVSDGRVWKVTAADGTKTELTGDALKNAAFTGGLGRVSFVNQGTNLFMANGGKIVYTNGTANTAYIADADAPTSVYQIGYLDGYLLAIPAGTGVMAYSAVNDPLTWSALDFVTAETGPDETVALGVAWREITLLGEQTMETWYNDGSTPFARLEGASTETGCESPNSLIQVGGQWLYIDNRRQLVRVEGRIPIVVSRPVQAYIDTFTYVSDCVTMFIEHAGRRWLVMTFPSSNKTLVVDFKGDPQQGWAEWGQWNGSVYNRWLPQSHAYCRGWHKHFVGSSSDGKLYTLDVANADDAGTAIRSIKRTAHIGYDTAQKKRSNWIRVRCRRDQYNANVTDPVLKVRWQDNNSGTWSSWYSMDMGSSGDTEFFVTKRRNGMYRTRQYEFLQDERCKMTIVEAEEEVELLAR